MRLLLDTCTFLWYVTASDRLSLRARDLLRDPGNDAYLSAVSVAEIALKTGLGHLRMAESPEIWVPEQRERHRLSPLPLEEAASARLSRLPSIHRDLFDRLLVAQAQVHDCLLVTPDPQIRAYAVATTW